MGIVTIRGQMGSWAPEIGERLAKRMKADYVDREIIAKVADLLNKHPRTVADKEAPLPGLFGRIDRALQCVYPTSGTAYFGVNIDPAVYAPAWEMPLDDSQYLAGLQSTLKALADCGAIVIAGRGSQFILKDQPDAIHTLVIAPLATRVKRVMESHELSEEAARKEIDRYDCSRRKFASHYFGAELWDPVNYDLVINSEHLGVEAASSTIVEALRSRTATTTASPG